MMMMARRLLLWSRCLLLHAARGFHSAQGTCESYTLCCLSWSPSHPQVGDMPRHRKLPPPPMLPFADLEHFQVENAG